MSEWIEYECNACSNNCQLTCYIEPYDPPGCPFSRMHKWKQISGSFVDYDPHNEMGTDKKLKIAKVFAVNQREVVAAFNEKQAEEYYTKNINGVIDYIKELTLTDFIQVKVDEDTPNAVRVGKRWWVNKSYYDVLKEYFDKIGEGGKLPYVISSTQTLQKIK